MSKIHSRREMEHHQVIARAIRDEDLLSEPLKYLVLDDVTHWMRMPGN